jgi:hypothetical protein
MPTELRRITITITPEIESLMNEAKKQYYNKSQSEMVRNLIIAGYNSIKIDETQRKKRGKKKIYEDKED